MAAFCLVTKLPPSVYRSLTFLEYKAFLEVIQQANASNGNPSI